jgi:hypothetical protein
MKECHPRGLKDHSLSPALLANVSQVVVARGHRLVPVRQARSAVSRAGCHVGRSRGRFGKSPFGVYGFRIVVLHRGRLGTGEFRPRP